MNNHDQVLRVWGDLACFTRPEMKVERFSYPVITPSAARGIYDAIYCKPVEFRWQITEVEILSPISWIALRRNEVKSVVSEDKLSKWMSGKAQPEPLLADDNDERTQRQTMALRDVNYLLHARIVPWPGYENRLAALEEQFERRASRGKCFYQPCFGCREFPAYFEPAAPEAFSPQKIDADIGPMLYDVFDLSRQGKSDSSQRISLFLAKIDAGRLRVPDWNDPAVLKPPLMEDRNAAPSC
jgi:CRISPR-associated protein Cas5d